MTTLKGTCETAERIRAAARRQVGWLMTDKQIEESIRRATPEQLDRLLTEVMAVNRAARASDQGPFQSDMMEEIDQERYDEAFLGGTR